MLQQAWDTRLLANKDMFGAMVLVALPEGIVGDRDQTVYNYDNAEMVQNILHHEFKIEVGYVVVLYILNGNTHPIFRCLSKPSMASCTLEYQLMSIMSWKSTALWLKLF